LRVKLQSDFALLDVRRGRRQLDKMIERGGKGHDLPKRVPVVIRGWITHRHGRDDGVSQEFGIDVAEVVVTEKR
jgi:hypothetical protein